MVTPMQCFNGSKSKVHCVLKYVFDLTNEDFIVTDVMTLLSMTPNLGRCRR